MDLESTYRILGTGWNVQKFDSSNYLLEEVLEKATKSTTPLKTNMSPENWWLEDVISNWNGPFSGDMLIFGGV